MINYVMIRQINTTARGGIVDTEFTSPLIGHVSNDRTAIGNLIIEGLSSILKDRIVRLETT